MKNNKEKSKSVVKNKRPKSASSNNVKTLFINGLKDIYWAEKYLVKSLPKFLKKISNEKLKETIEEHLTETEEHANRLEMVFDFCQIKTSSKKCEAMVGLVEEYKKATELFNRGPLLDAALIIGIQKIKHYEMAAYGALHVLSDVLGMEDCSALLKKTLDEEHEVGKKLNELAGEINQEAFNASSEEKAMKNDLQPTGAYMSI